MSDPWDQATNKLIELTKTGQLVWDSQPNERYERGRDLQILGPVYATETNGKRIAVYEGRAVHWDDEGRPIRYTPSNILVEFVDADGNVEWTWPSPRGRYELLEEIQFQAVDANSFLKDFLPK
ncbi:MAG TPA: hypothetical protein VNQ76_09885 [Planctomicrobium sp.]|nr:hypothetical protein [Planctomicrobium sp.]